MRGEGAILDDISAQYDSNSILMTFVHSVGLGLNGDVKF